MKKILTVIALALLLPAAALCADKKKDEAPPKPTAQTAKKDVPTMAPAAAPTETEIAQMRVVTACYIRCREKISNNVIQKTEGMTCIDLCIDDALASANTGGSIRGRVYIKLSSGEIEKGLKMKIALLRLDIDPKEKPENLQSIRENLVKLVNAPSEAKKTIACSSPNEYKNCGYGNEKELAIFAAGVVTTDIDNGVYTVSGVPDGTYVMWLDWYKANPADPNTGTLYRWLRPVQVSKGKQIAADFSEENISYVLVNFPRTYLGQ